MEDKKQKKVSGIEFVKTDIMAVEHDVERDGKSKIKTIAGVTVKGKEYKEKTQKQINDVNNDVPVKENEEQEIEDRQ